MLYRPGNCADDLTVADSNHETLVLSPNKSSSYFKDLLWPDLCTTCQLAPHDWNRFSRGYIQQCKVDHSISMFAVADCLLQTRSLGNAYGY